MRRAKAYEQLGQHKQALADMQRANRLDAATAETRVRHLGGRASISGGRWHERPAPRHLPPPAAA